MCSTCTAHQKIEWGCDAYQDEKGEWQKKALIPERMDNEDVWVCPRRPVKDDPAFYSELMSLYALYKEGVLADEGSIMSQSTKYVNLMRLVHAAVNECYAEKNK